VRLRRPAWRLDRDRFLDVAYLGIAIAIVLLRLLSVPPWDQSSDAWAYHRPVGPAGPYDAAEVGVIGSYLYSPVFKLVLVPAGWLPWGLFNAAWTALNLALLRALADRRWVLPIAAIIASPFTWRNVLAMAVAVIPLTVPAATPRLAALLAGQAAEPPGRRT
jgi:hypothetical protein